MKDRAKLVHAGPLRVSHGSVGFVTVGSFRSPESRIQVQEEAVIRSRIMGRLGENTE